MRLTTLPPSCAVVTKSGNLNLLEPSGPVQACNGIALPLPLPLHDNFSVYLHCGWRLPSSDVAENAAELGTL